MALHRAIGCIASVLAISGCGDGSSSGGVPASGGGTGGAGVDAGGGKGGTDGGVDAGTGGASGSDDGGGCTPGATECQGDTPRTCDASGKWQAGAACPYACISGACAGVCSPGSRQCSGSTPETCDASGQWKGEEPCAGPTPVCSAGQCEAAPPAPPSCQGLARSCGPAQDEDCCASPAVSGGTYDRSNDPSFPATVSNFRLDRFEVTVGRFRKFVAAYPASKPAAGAGAHPLISGSG
jgi:formylglycine-generating enzyme